MPCGAFLQQLHRFSVTCCSLSCDCSGQFSSVAQSCLTVCDPMNRSMPGLPVQHQLPELTQTHAHWAGDAIQPSHPLSSLLLPPLISPSIRVFSNESALRIRWPKYWSFSFSISPSKEYSGLISFRMDWLDLLAVQGTSPAPVASGTSNLQSEHEGRCETARPLPCLGLCSLSAAICRRSLIQDQREDCRRPMLMEGRDGYQVSRLLFSIFPFSCSPPPLPLCFLFFLFDYVNFFSSSNFSPPVFLIFSQSLFLFLSH